jgi:hypothetical protein
MARQGEDADRFLQRVDKMVKEQSAAALAGRGTPVAVKAPAAPSPSPTPRPQSAEWPPAGGTPDRRHHRR